MPSLCALTEVPSQKVEEIVWAEDPVTEVRAVVIGRCVPEVQGQIEKSAVLHLYNAPFPYDYAQRRITMFI